MRTETIERTDQASFQPNNPGTDMIQNSTISIAPALDIVPVLIGAACSNPGFDNGVFFSDELQDIAAAKTICASCPALAECLEGAIDRSEPWGVWGGQLFRNGRALTAKRRRGRPPKNPRPEDVFVDIPVPNHLRSRLRTA